MSFKVSKITVGKGKTVQDEKAGTWEKQYFELEIIIQDEKELQTARDVALALLDQWLGLAANESAGGPADHQGPGAQDHKKGYADLPYDPEKIVWQDRQGAKGKFQLSEDHSNPDHQALLKFLAEHAGGCVSSKTHFYWVFTDQKTVGRKLKAAGKQGTDPSKPVEEACQKTSLLFPEDLRSLLSFEQKDDAIVIKPRQFLGSENFSRIAEIVKQQGGQYVSAGRGSHFKIPKKE